MTLLSTMRIDEPDLERLRAAGLVVHLVDNRVIDSHGSSRARQNGAICDLPEDLRARAEILIHPAYSVSEELVRALPALKWVHHPGAGINSGGELWTDWDLIERTGLVVTTTKMHAAPISEMIVTFMLMLDKHMVAHERARTSRTYNSAARQRTPRLVAGTTVLIVGTGNVGQEAARKLKLAFGTTNYGVNSDGRNIDYFDRCMTLDQIDEFLPTADYVVLAAALTRQTEGLIDHRRLSLLSRESFLVNVSRGEMIDEPALIAALENNDIAGAGLDVFAVEPLPPESPLWDMENVILTPHRSGAAPGGRSSVVSRVLENLDAFRSGRTEDLVGFANTKHY